MTTTQQDRVAILLDALGPDVCESVLSHLDANRALPLRNRVRSVADAPPDPQEQQDVLADFERFFRHAHSETSRPRIAPETSGPQDADDTDDEPELTDDAFENLKLLKPLQIARALEDEVPQTIALVMNSLDAEQAGEVLTQFPEAVRVRVFLQMRQLSGGKRDILERIVRMTVEKARQLDDDALQSEDQDSAAKMAEILRSIAKKDRSRMLDVLDQNDPATAGRVRELLYSFDDLLRIEDRSIQKLLGEVDSQTLAKAIKDTGDEFLDKITQNLSRRAREALVEELDLLAAVDPDEQKETQKEVVQVIARLDQAGELVMIA